MDLAGKSKSIKKNQKAPKQRAPKKSPKRKRIEEELEHEDELVIADGHSEPEETVMTPAVKAIGAFEGGFVHLAFRNTASAYWRKSTETELFLSVLSNDMAINGIAFGAIYVKSSFIKKTGGSALM